MSNINFDQPSTGNVNSTADALAVTNQGSGNALHGQSAGVNNSGVWGDNVGAGYGVSGSTNSANAAGVWGDNKGFGPGVRGTNSAGGFAIIGETTGTNAFGGGGTAVSGIGRGSSDGVHGDSDSGTGIQGNSNSGPGVSGASTNGDAVTGLSQNKNGVHGTALGGGGAGVLGGSATGDGVRGESNSNQHAGVSAINDSGGFGLWARGNPAGHFEGNVEVTGDITLIGPGQDLAEDFAIPRAEEIEPGTVVVIDNEDALQPSIQAYDKRVAGVVSGAGNVRAGIILGRQESEDNRMPIALMGKVYCKVDADYSAIAVGDLLTTSPTQGHAMKAYDPLKAFGSVIGKALRPLHSGRGLIPILVALQ